MKKSLSKIAMLALLSISSFGTYAAAGNSGNITVSGEVVDSPCNLAPGLDGTDIQVPFGQLSMSRLNAGQTAQQTFQIMLTDCDMSGGKTASIKFDSPNLVNGTTLIRPSGSSTGLGVGIQEATIGVSDPLNVVSQDTNMITYTAVVKKAIATTPVTTGSFNAVIPFVISYQ